MTLKEQYKQDLDSLAFDVQHNGMEPSELISELKLIASSYHVPYMVACDNLNNMLIKAYDVA